MGTLWRSLSFALRLLRNSPGFACVAVLTLGLGIAANTTVFAWIDTVLLRPVPGASNASRLVVLEAISPDGRRLSKFQHPDFRDFQRQMTLASGVTAAHQAFFTIGPPDHAQRVMGQVVSANFFDVLGVKPYLGRLFRSDEDRDSPGSHPFAVISHRLWRAYFHSDFGMVGRTVRINGHHYTLIGVAQADFGGTTGGIAFDVWVPLSMIIQTGTLNTWAAADRNARFLDVLASLKPGVSLDQADQETRAVASRIAAAYPDTHRGIGATAVPIWRSSSGLQSGLRNPLQILLAVCLLVMLIACANVANLLMARSVSRQREFGIRMALGASRLQIVRQLLVEVLVLAVAGALAGVVLAAWLSESLFYVLPKLDAPIRAAIEPLLHPKPNPSVLLFTALLATGAALLATLMPALYAGRVDVNETLKEGGRSGASGTRSHRARGVLVMAEVALAAIALIGAGWAVRTFQKLARVHLGFEPQNVLVAHFHLSTNGYSLDREKRFARDLRLRLETSPAVEQVSYGNAVPVSIFSPGSERVQNFGSEADRQGVVSVGSTVVAPGYFRLMRIPLLEGRDFTERDDLTTEPVIVVNQTFVERYFVGQNPIGRRVRVSGRWVRVAGLVKDSKYRTPAEAPAPHFYGAFGQMFWSGHNHFLYVRGRNLDAARAALHREAAALDPNQGLYEVSTLAERAQASLFGERITASLLSALAVLALALAAIGLYCVMAYAVTERTQEIGIRMALGAERRQVVALVLWKGLALTLAGLAVGVTAALLAARVFAGILELTAIEPAVFVLAALLLLATDLLACYVPARRAASVDPMISLRSE